MRTKRTNESGPPRRSTGQDAGGDRRAEPSPVAIIEVRRPSDFPDWVTVDGLARFLHESMKPYEDPLPDTHRGVREAFAERGGRSGFVLIAETDRRLAGALVMHATGMKGYVPENLVLYVAVDRSIRGRGVGTNLIRHALSLCDGDVKLHVEPENPARALYERMGFTSRYAEMRFQR